ncbi:MAG: twin-arginine translocase TatA/TatE family subunit [Nitrospina sp.]|nr:MAG: twin-arginine translocase TatA/TatE family subunit [Nitrospina sp.]
MMGIGFPELMIILVIIMIIFGAGKLPEIGSAFGRSIKNFKTSMKEAEEVSSEEAEPVAEVEAGTESTDAGQEPAGQEPAAQESAAPADPGIAKTEQTAPPPASPNPVKAQAKKPAPAPAKAPPAKGKSVKKAAKSEEEKMIEDAINELKSKRIGTIKTPHDGLVQQNDVFTESVKRNPWGRKMDRGVRRDVL